mmetsp:Transcript_13051/g.51036  ORF Transcript_13051/g.51036 Transcript_13051/m.51036 type:complete len:175 (+) Transcript_13051:300-824(+)
MLSIVQNPNCGSCNSKQAAQLPTRRKIKRYSRTSQISSHEFNELVAALSSWNAICRRRRRVNVHRTILSPVTKSVLIPGGGKSCVFMDTFGKGTKFFHTSKFLTPRKFGALQWNSQQGANVFLCDDYLDFLCLRNLFLERSFLVPPGDARFETLMQNNEYNIKLQVHSINIFNT